MRRIQGVIFACVTLAIGPLVLCAAQPSTQPAALGATGTDGAMGIAVDPSSPPTGSGSADTNVSAGATDDTAPSRRPDRTDSATSAAPLGRGRLGPRMFGPVSAKEIADAMTYLTEHSRNRADAIKSLPDGDRKQRIMEVVARNYINWMRILNQDPELYKIVVQRVEVEDNIFGLVTKLRKEPADQHDITQSKLRGQVTELVSLGIQERQIRLQRLQNTVKQLAAKLQDDSNHQSDLVDQRLKTILSDGKSLIPSSGGGSGGAGLGNGGLGGGLGGGGNHGQRPGDDNR